MNRLWTALRDRLGLHALQAETAHIHEHQQRQEAIMAKLADELDDISRRQTAIRDAITASGANLRTALDKLNTEVEALRNGDLSSENQARVDAIKAAADDIRAAAESADDGYEAPIVEPSPFSPADDGSVAGSAAANTTPDSKSRGKN